MKIVVGLGNPDKEYENTFHNLGFMCVDKLAEKLGVSFDKNKCKALIAETKIGLEKVLIVKPQTYMNLSGESVREILSYYKANLCDLIVVYDDYDLTKGSLRIRENGSSGTHNGMRNVIKELKSSDFCRVRVGFKDTAPSQIPLINKVLSGIKGEDVEIFDKITELASMALYDFITGKKIQDVMQKYNLVNKG